MEIEPFWMYTYWEVTAQDQLQATRQTGMIGSAAQWILRFNHITGSEWLDPKGRSFFDLPVDLASGRRYVNLWSGGRSYCAELGMVPASTGFIPVCRSNVITVAPSAPPPGGEPRWLKVQGIFEKGGDSPGAGTSDGRGAVLCRGKGRLRFTGAFAGGLKGWDYSRNQAR